MLVSLVQRSRMQYGCSRSVCGSRLPLFSVSAFCFLSGMVFMFVRVITIALTVSLSHVFHCLLQTDAFWELLVDYGITRILQSSVPD